MAFCTSTITITDADFTGAEAHTLSWNISADVIPVREFGDTTNFGNVISCAQTGEVVVGTYDFPSCEIGDTGTLTGNCASVAFSIPYQVVSGPNLADADSSASAAINFTTTLRMTGDPSFT